MNVGFPLLAFSVFKWLSMNLGRSVIVTPAVSRIGSVGKVMPAKNVSSSAISCCQCGCIAGCGLTYGFGGILAFGGSGGRLGVGGGVFCGGSGGVIFKR